MNSDVSVLRMSLNKIPKIRKRFFKEDLSYLISNKHTHFIHHGKLMISSQDVIC